MLALSRADGRRLPPRNLSRSLSDCVLHRKVQRGFVDLTELKNICLGEE